MGEYTDGIERINIELSIAQQARSWSTRSSAFFATRQPAARQERRRRATIAPAELLGDRVQQAARCWRRARAGAGCWRPRPAAAEARADGSAWTTLPSSTRARAAAGRDACSTLLQDHTVRVSWKTRDPRAAARRSSPAPRSSRSSTSANAIHKRGAARPRVRRAAHARRRRQRAHQHPGQLATTTRCCRTAHAAVARIMALARSLDGVISGEHGIGITKLEFLTDDEIARLRATTSSASIRKAASTRASCCDAAGGRRRPAQRLHAVASA